MPHMCIGLSMACMSSPDDPLFFLHHSNLDRLYHLWADCHEYENIPSASLTPNQYSAQNPSAPGGAVARDPYAGTVYNVGMDSPVPFYLGYPSVSLVIPVSKFPTPRELWGLGTAGQPGYDGICYRYGPDELVASFGSSCTNNIQWTWVNQGSKKRDVEGDDTMDHMEEDNHPNAKLYSKLGETFRTEVAKGRDHKEVLHEMAMEECLKAPKLQLTEQFQAWATMNNLPLSAFDSICDKPSERLDSQQTQQLQQANNSLSVPLWVSVSAIVGIGLLFLAVVVLVIIYVRKRNSVASSDGDHYSQIE